MPRIPKIEPPRHIGQVREVETGLGKVWAAICTPMTPEPVRKVLEDVAALFNKSRA